jgi:hypothetical protein
MADYLVTGKKGNGKSLVCVSRIRDALLAGRRVATNLDLDLVAMLGPFHRKVCVYRLPDKPTVDDLNAIGRGHDDDSYDEDRNGLLVLDELATWMNARSYQDKRRGPVLDWLAHSRKKRWDTYLICQAPTQIDKQVREALVEYHVVCRRMDKLKVAGVKLPKVHVGFVKFGMDRDSILSERWIYRGVDLYKAYDTEQVFLDTYSNGLFSYLPPYTVDGRYREPPGLGYRLFGKVPPTLMRYQVKPKLPHVAKAMRLPPSRRLAILQAVELAPDGAVPCAI